MPLVNVMVNQRAYTIACDEGEEGHLRELAAHVDGKVRGLLESVGQVGEQRLLLMAALLVADDYFDSVGLLERRAQEIEDLAGTRDEMSTRIAGSEEKAALELEQAAKRVGDIAQRLSRA
ncbi:MAG TPA: cell division protein ZapA [Rhizomicrobium sp.]|jgi:cell division protein ZapA|nr:cell division protein ZapA [Rhizomicrobium sp.]